MIGGGTAAWVGRGVLAMVWGLYVVCAWYLILHLPAFPMEVAYADGQGSWLFSTMRRFWDFTLGDDLVGARSLSALCAFGAIGLTYRIGVALSRDQTVGAFLALGFVLFPPITGIFSMATPHALSATLGLAAIALVVEPRVSLRRAWRGAGAVLLLAAAVGIGIDGVPKDSLGGPGQGTALGAVILPYAMLWVGTLMALPASRSLEVRGRLGCTGLRVVRIAPLVVIAFLGILAICGDWQAGQLLIAAGYVFGVGLLGVLPLIMWVRFVMPGVRSILAWLAFPVIMYSCFWVVLGPVSRDSFPYNWIGLENRAGRSSMVPMTVPSKADKVSYFIDYK